MGKEKELLEESKGLLALAEMIQDDTQPLEERKRKLDELSDLYHAWYRSALALFDVRRQQAERQKFEQEYEGSIWHAKIIKFLTLGLQASPLYDPDKPVFDKWTYPFIRSFKEPLLKQCNILANLENTLVISDEENEVWNATIRRIFTVFIEKAESAKTNHEKKLTFEYLSIFLIGAVEGLTVIGHDQRGASEEIDLWVANDSMEGFWQRHVGDGMCQAC